MDLNTLIDFCKDKYPQKMIEICEAIDLLVDVLINLKSDIGKEIPILNENESYESAHKFLDYSEDISRVIRKLNIISNDITIDETLDDILEENDEKDIDYSDKSFNVDPKVPHSIYDDFTYTKPAGIEIGEVYLEANTWQDILNKCCQYLYQRNPQIMNSFPDSDIMKGRSCKYFSFDANDLRNANLIYNSNIYVENNVSATFVRNLIVKMLEQYEIPKRQCHIFIRRDLTSAHSTDANIKKVTQNIENSNNEIKIGQYAKEYFIEYFRTNTSKETTDKFTNKDWCHDIFGICYPILKQVDINLPIGEQVHYNNQYRRYYSNPVLQIGGNHYIICSQWYAHFKPKLIDWINRNSSNIDMISKNILEIGDKLKFGKDYNSITIPKQLFVDVIKTIGEYDSKSFETSYITEIFSENIIKETNYEKPHHVINNIRKYLENQSIISLCDNYKKGKYKITNMEGLQKLIDQYSDIFENKFNNKFISYGDKAIIYSYYDRKQITIKVGDMDDEYVYLHDDCIGKNCGEKFTFNHKEYVIVNFKKQIKG